MKYPVKFQYIQIVSVHPINTETEQVQWLVYSVQDKILNWWNVKYLVEVETMKGSAKVTCDIPTCEFSF